MAEDAERSAKVQKLRKLLRFQPLRFVHIFFSLLLTIYGTGIFLATITVKSELVDYLPFLHFYLEKPVYVLLIGSTVLISLGCLGIISSAQNLYQGIVTFGVLLFGLFMFKFTMGAVFLAVINSAEKSIKQALETHMNNYTENSYPMDYVQTNLTCCGVDDFTDWNPTLGYIPGSCCSSDSPCGFADIINLNETGCYAALKNLIFYFINYLIIILAVLAALQVTAIIITFFLARGIADVRRRISRCNEDGKLGFSESEESTKTHNPLGSRSTNHHQHLREKELKSNSFVNDVGSPFSGKKLDHKTKTKSAAAVPAVGSGRLDNNIVRNPIYRDDSFNYDRNMRPKTAPIILSPPARAHRRFPIGF